VSTNAYSCQFFVFAVELASALVDFVVIIWVLGNSFYGDLVRHQIVPVCSGDTKPAVQSCFGVD
jgi:hypothetical protein